MVDQELVTTIAVTLATKTAEGLAAGGRAAFEALVRLVRRRFDEHGSAPPAEPDPDPGAGSEADRTAETRIEILRRALARAVADDPGFEAELRDHWRALAPHLKTGEGDVLNSVSGTVQGTVVQARDVHGGISFGGPGPAQR